MGMISVGTSGDGNELSGGHLSRQTSATFLDVGDKRFVGDCEQAVRQHVSLRIILIHMYL